MPQEPEANLVDPSENPGGVANPSAQGEPAADASAEQAEQSLGEPGDEGDGPNRWGDGPNR